MRRSKARVSEGIFIEHKHQRRATKMYISTEQRRDIITRFNDATFILMDFYVSLTKVKNPDYSDKYAATKIGWKISKVRKLRQELVKNNYFYSNKQGNITITYLFPELVLEVKADLENKTTISYTDDNICKLVAEQ